MTMIDDPPLGRRAYDDRDLVTREELVGRLTDMRQDLKDDIGDLRGAVHSVSEQVREGFLTMNGRVRTIEAAHTFWQGFRAAFHWLPALLIAAATAAISVLITLLIAHATSATPNINVGGVHPTVEPPQTQSPPSR